MYSFDDLFDKREVVAHRLELFMKNNNISKAKLCKDANISRPTLDKLLAVDITSKANFEKHVKKIFDVLGLTPDNLLSELRNPYVRIKEYLDLLNLSADEISKATGISVDRLLEIESGKDASIIELRDIALCCQTSINAILGNEYFEPPYSKHYFYKESDWVSGYWGHMGVSLSTQEKSIWYPITEAVRKRAFRTMDQEFMVLPCMNNKLLLINMSKVDKITFLDDDCESIPFEDNLGSENELGICGEIPLVIYDALDDWPTNENMSEIFKSTINQVVEEAGWDEEDVYDIKCGLRIICDKKIDSLKWDGWGDCQSITDVVTSLYEFGELPSQDMKMYFTTLDETEVFINLNNISMIELPLVLLERVICDERDEMLKELED